MKRKKKIIVVNEKIQKGEVKVVNKEIERVDNSKIVEHLNMKVDKLYSDLVKKDEIIRDMEYNSDKKQKEEINELSKKHKEEIDRLNKEWQEKIDLLRSLFPKS